MPTFKVGDEVEANGVPGKITKIDRRFGAVYFVRPKGFKGRLSYVNYHFLWELKRIY